MRRAVEALILAVVLGAGVWWFKSSGDNAQMRARSRLCQSNLREIARAMSAYTKDYGAYPAVASSDRPNPKSFSAPFYGWADLMVHASKCRTCVNCPAESTPPDNDPTSGAFTDYWFNANLSGKKPFAVVSPAAVFLLGDGATGQDQADGRYSFKTLPAQWSANPLSPLHRHRGGANYLFADGHVKWLAVAGLASRGSSAAVLELR